MNNRIKVTIAYMEDDQLNEIIQLLKPKLKGAKIRKNDVPKPYKHAYITIKNQESENK
ncbi:MAG: hypothetical protein N4A63_13370 [Vallitalea sp.]|jgi:hypothetical protein|nr:hypothetical protein [Vallitalea sp.]